MKVILVKDEQATKDAVYLGILGGSLEDPRDFYGMAHFLEHSVFLGSENYPGEQDYPQFMKSKSGRHNAATSFSKTSYLFTLAPGPAIVEGVKRLTDMIVNPKLRASSVAREMKGEIDA
jgi:secreted Zn-dependent insulinase-like peptidase